MARVAIFTSGNGSNFEAITKKILADGRHTVSLMVCNRKAAFSFSRAATLGVESYYLCYMDREPSDVEEEIIGVLKDKEIDLIVLAGFMKILTPKIIDAFPNKIINIHPSLLPKYPGAHAIEESFNGDDECYGITIHYVDYGMDSGPIIVQKKILRVPNISREDFECSIHGAEHEAYPEVVINLLNKIDKDRL